MIIIFIIFVVKKVFIVYDIWESFIEFLIISWIFIVSDFYIILDVFVVFLRCDKLLRLLQYIWLHWHEIWEKLREIWKRLRERLRKIWLWLKENWLYNSSRESIERIILRIHNNLTRIVMIFIFFNAIFSNNFVIQSFPLNDILSN